MTDKQITTDEKMHFPRFGIGIEFFDNQTKTAQDFGGFCSDHKEVIIKELEKAIDYVRGIE